MNIDYLRAKTTTVMEEYVYPNEPLFEQGGPEAGTLLSSIQAEVKRRGLWAPHLPKAAGGLGIGFMPYAYMNEIIGRSLHAPAAFGSQAPDAGNAEILWQFGTPAQQQQWLAPLVNGDIRSSFAMTEPEVSGADPTGLQATGVRDGDDWVINAHKWFITGASRAAFFIVMVGTELDAPLHDRFTQIIVHAGTPGLEIVRPIRVMGEMSGDHNEIRFTDVRVPITNTLGEPGSGFRIAQRRLGPGRIHHAMRWLGQMQRAFDIMCRFVLQRQVGGEPLADKQTIQNWIADSLADIQSCRLLTINAAEKIDSGDEARVEISLIKFFGALALERVINRAMQAHGAKGLSDDTPLERMYREARAARIYDGPDEVHRIVVARRALRPYREGGAWSFV